MTTEFYHGNTIAFRAYRSWQALLFQAKVDQSGSTVASHSRRAASSGWHSDAVDIPDRHGLVFHEEGLLSCIRFSLKLLPLFQPVSHDKIDQVRYGTVFLYRDVAKLVSDMVVETDANRVYAFWRMRVRCGHYGDIVVRPH